MLRTALYYAPHGCLYFLFQNDKLLQTAFQPFSCELNYFRLPEVWQDKFDRYFSGSLKSFDYPPSDKGTAFQRRVWQKIAEIPFGQTRTYGEIARALNSGARAVGTACGKNPLPVIIPCHRVVAAHGIGGFSGGGAASLTIKAALLAHEGAWQWTK